MALVLRHPTKHDWEHVRLTAEKFRREQHTADWIARQLGVLFGYRVTKKMVYDRLREWHAPPKYQRGKPLHRVARAVSTPPADVQIHAALSSIGAFLDDCHMKAAWPPPQLHLELDFQRLVAEALMAISSTSYDARAVWQELSRMEERVGTVVHSFRVVMHPRVLSVLLRVLVQNQQTDETQRAAVRLFKRMIWKQALDSLQASHPVASLCALDLTPEKTEDFLEKFTTQLNHRLYNRMDQSAADFVALEKIYTARALASFGYPRTADDVLESAASLSVQDGFTRADYHRTVGFSQFQKNIPIMTEAALNNLQLALDGFEGVGKGESIEAMYVHYNLGSIFERMRNDKSCIENLEAALRIWEGKASPRRQSGGIKYVRDLYEAYKRMGRFDDMHGLRERFATYFEESTLVENE